MNRHHVRSVALGAMSIAAIAIAGCGGAMAPSAAPPESPAVAAEPTPTNPDEALAQIERAEGELDRVLGRSAALQSPADLPTTVPTSPPTASAPPPEPASAPRPQSEASPAKGAEASGASGGVAADPCETACRALTSMERAVDHLCGLAGESDARCENARTRSKSASGRVHAQCPACAGR